MTKPSYSLCLMLMLLPGLNIDLHGDELLNGHVVKLDSSGKLLSWLPSQETAYDQVMRKAWDFLLSAVPVESNGLKSYFSYCCVDPKSYRGTPWLHNPAGLYAMLVDSAVSYYAYSGDRRVVELVQEMLDYQLRNGTTQEDWTWGSVPYASSDPGAVYFRGAHDFLYDAKEYGRGDGYGVIEPDKIGELGYGYLKFFLLTGQERFRQAALDCANALARNIRSGDVDHSPWPFRVYAETNVAREEYCSNLIGSIRLFDACVRMNWGNVPSYMKARRQAWSWLTTYPLQNNRWVGYFEDVPAYKDIFNLNQYSPMETARYLMEFPDTDQQWRQHVPQLIDWVEKTFVLAETPKEKSVQWGAHTVSEQTTYMFKMGSHTSRYASINALWYEKTGDVSAREKAFRSFNWSTYMCQENGLVHVGPVEPSVWFSDGYGDYIRHFLSGLGAVPEWAPSGQDHLLRSSSIVTSIAYMPGEFCYQTYDEESTEVIRLSFVPKTVTADGKRLLRRPDLTQPGWTFSEDQRALRIYHSGARTIRVS